MFDLLWTQEAREQYDALADRAKGGRAGGLLKQVNKTLRFLAANPRHPRLQTHEFSSLDNPYDKQQKVFQAHVQNRTPNAYRIFWCYGPEAGQITIIAITPHP